MKKRPGLAEFLKEKRMTAGLTQSEVATNLGYSSPQFVSNWERGLANPPIFVLRDLTKMYKVSVDHMCEMLVEDFKADLQKELSGAKSKRR